jgi:DNA-binding NtrC family response regulator
MKNLLGRLAITVNKNIIEASDIPAPYNPYLFVDTEATDSLFAFSSFSDARKAFEKTFILKKLNQYGQSVQNTAKAIGESVAYVQKILQNID